MYVPSKPTLFIDQGPFSCDTPVVACLSVETRDDLPRPILTHDWSLS